MTASRYQLWSQEKGTSLTLAPILPSTPRCSLQKCIYLILLLMESLRWLPTLVNTSTPQDSPQQDPIQFSLPSVVGL